MIRMGHLFLGLSLLKLEYFEIYHYNFKKGAMLQFTNIRGGF